MKIKKLFIGTLMKKTRMHSSRMRTAHSSSHLLGEGVSASVHAGIYTPWVWAWRSPPPGVGLETPPSQTPKLPPWVWAWRPPQSDPSTSPWVWAWRPLNLPPGCGSVDLQGMLGYHPPPPDRMTDTCKNITFSLCQRFHNV